MGCSIWASGKLDLSLKAARDFEQVRTSNGHYEHPDITSLFRRPMCYRADERGQIDGKGEDCGKHDGMPHAPFGAPQKYWDLYLPD